MKFEFDLPDDLSLNQLSAQRTKGGIQWHAYVRDKDYRFRGGDFTWDLQSAIDTAVANLRAVKPERPAATPRFTLNLSSLTRKSNGPDQS